VKWDPLLWLLQGVSDQQLNGAAAPTAVDGTTADGARQDDGLQPHLDGQQLDGRQPGFVALDEASVVGFVATKPHLAERLGGIASRQEWKVLKL
jgi:hypothetical protein